MASPQTADGANVYYSSAASGKHQPGCMPAQREGRSQIDLDDPVPHLKLHIERRRVVPDACVVDKDIDLAPQSLHSFIESALQVATVAKIGRDNLPVIGREVRAFPSTVDADDISSHF
ncbi:hypothetical protein AGR4C_pc10017 [Agrobacterium tumefaciens str. Kerr 14]|uniref:Uncharacterized protein n=2 Tax=Agrobacterium TaxID=357 RepID=A0A1S7S6V5_9HYPH|nr:hypothetical protein AGR7C_pTi0161 [Agrobacterium deltaense Zutra 3/1]CUX68334.1 hypothetical protein AGR4C_pc10017 [Agrobacterium tumefaciens str. Kerr 14]